MRVLVLDKTRTALAPTSPKRARRLLKAKKAAIFKRFPFTIILFHEITNFIPPMELKIDPGGTTGFALIADHKTTGKVAVLGFNLKHRSSLIKERIQKRAMYRRSRRQRKTRYRKARFLNRTRPKGWLPPSLMHRVLTTMTWIKRLMRYAPIGSISMELNKFDPQKMMDPNISGIQYQQGTLAGYEIREYLLQKWNHKCAYCKKENVPLQIEHVIPRSRNGSDRIDNLVIACKPCNEKKDTKTAAEFGYPDIEKQIKKPLHEPAYMNAVRFRLKKEIEQLGLPNEFAYGYQTKMNRIQQNHPKDHWIDAACVGNTGTNVSLETNKHYEVKCVGHGHRRMVKPNKYGFPSGKPKSRTKLYFGFQTGDYAKAHVLRGKKKGIYTGRIACRKTGSFDIQTKTNKITGLNHKYFKSIQKSDGYFVQQS